MASNATTLDPVQQYFSELAQFPHLSDEEVQALSERIALARTHQQPHIEAQVRQQLVEGLLTEVLPTAQHYAARMPRLSLLDLIQQGNYGLLLAAERYDFRDTTRRFGAYALTYIRGMIKCDLHKDVGLSIPSASFYTLRAQGKLDTMFALAPLSLERARGEKDEEWSLQNMLASPLLRL
jgi:Sigma-70 region 2